MAQQRLAMHKIKDVFRLHLLGGGRLADAILDRLVHNAHRIDLSSKESMRKTAAS